MSTSSIEWTEATWNPVTGCTRVSAGCDNCYAFTMTRRLAGMGQEKYQGLVNPGKKHFNGVVKTWDDVLTLPLKTKKPTTFFVNSMSDLFHEGVPFSFIDKVFAVMALTPQHTYQVLTKRVDVALDWFNYKDLSWANEGMQGTERIRYAAWHNFGGMIEFKDFVWPLPNVIMMASVEDQPAANERIPLLLQIPAAIRGLSCEPLLGPVEFSDVTKRSDAVSQLGKKALDGIHWVIAGGESGPKARPSHPDWFRSLRDQCQAAGVAFFFKQWGAWAADVPLAETGKHKHTAIYSDPETQRTFPVSMNKVGKAAAGRLLDGREWNEMPV